MTRGVLSYLALVVAVAYLVSMEDLWKGLGVAVALIGSILTLTLFLLKRKHDKEDAARKRRHDKEDARLKRKHDNADRQREKKDRDKDAADKRQREKEEAARAHRLRSTICSTQRNCRAPFVAPVARPAWWFDNNGDCRECQHGHRALQHPMTPPNADEDESDWEQRMTLAKRAYTEQGRSFISDFLAVTQRASEASLRGEMPPEVSAEEATDEDAEAAREAAREAEAEQEAGAAEAPRLRFPRA